MKENSSPSLPSKSVHHVSWFDIVNKEKGKKKKERKKIHFEFSYHRMIFDVLITVRVFRDKERERERKELGQNCAVKSGKYMRTNSAKTKQRGPLLYRSISCGGNV